MSEFWPGRYRFTRPQWITEKAGRVREEKTMRDKRLRLLRLPAMAVAALVVGLFSVGLADAAPTVTPSVEQAEAIAKPSVVFIQTQWDGYLVSAPFPGTDILGMLSPGGSAPEYKLTAVCTGFIANPSGYVVTAGHCVDDQSMRYGGRGLIIEAAVADLAKKANLTSAQAQTILNYGYSNWTVQGHDSGSPPDRVVGVFPTKAASGIPVTTPLQANVINVQPFNKGDVALLKVESTTPMPALQVAPTTPDTGTQVVALGYPGSVSETVDASTDPSMKDGTISGDRTVNGVPITEISAATSPGMSGGPIVDLQGRVVGTDSWSPGAETQPFNFMTATSSVHDILASNSVNNTLSQTDQTYRAGLTDYFAGKYHDAVNKFDQVLQLEPDHAMAQQYKRLAITNYPKETSKSSNTLLYILIGAGVVVLGLAIAATLVMRKRRGGGAPGTTQIGLPAGGGPAATTAMPTPVMPPTPRAEAPPAVPATAATAPPITSPIGAPPLGPPAEQLTPRTQAAIPAVGETQPALASTYCPFCGERHEPDAHFCAACGFHFPSKQQTGGGA